MIFEGKDWKFYMMILTTVVGIVLLGESMTGNVISESCCFGPNCAPDNLCDSAKPLVESDNSIFLYLGVFFLATSIFLLISRRVEGF
jgi:hypothetical protein